MAKPDLDIVIDCRELETLLEFWADARGRPRRIRDAPNEDPLTERTLVGALHSEAQRFRLAGS